MRGRKIAISRSHPHPARSIIIFFSVSHNRVCVGVLCKRGFTCVSARDEDPIVSHFALENPLAKEARRGIIMS